MADPNTIVNAITNGITHLQNSFTQAITNAAQAIQLQPQVAAGMFIQTPLHTSQAVILDLTTKDGPKYITKW